MVIAIIVILFAVGLFLVLHDDHDNSYTKSEKKPTRQRDITPATQKPAVSQGIPRDRPVSLNPGPSFRKKNRPLISISWTGSSTTPSCRSGR